MLPLLLYLLGAIDILAMNVQGSNSGSTLPQATGDLSILTSSVARLEGRMGKLEATVEKKMDRILEMMRQHHQGQEDEHTVKDEPKTPEQTLEHETQHSVEGRPPREP